MMRVLFATMIVVAAQIVSAANFTLVTGATDWSDPRSYAENAGSESGPLPGAEDTVFIPNGMTAQIDDSNMASWNVFANVDKVLFNGQTSVLEIHVGETEGVPNERDVGCEVHYKSTGTSSNRYKYGLVTKYGAGKIRFTKKVNTVLWTSVDAEGRVRVVRSGAILMVK